MKGVIVPVATPLTKDGDLDREGLSRLIEYLIAAGVHGLFANGSMSGFAFHPERRQVEIIEAVVAFTAGRVPVVAGIADTSIERVLERAASLRGIALEAYVVLPPYYFLYSQEELRLFFRTVAARVDKPVILYENPRLVLNSLDPATLASLSAHPAVVAIKHSAADPEAWQELLNLLPSRRDVSLICGAEKKMSTGLRMGFDGMTGGFHNLMPELAVQMYEAAVQQQWDRCEQLQEQLNRGYRIFETAGGWRGLDVALDYMGIAHHAAPEPFAAGLDNSTRERILDAVIAANLPRPFAAATTI